MKKDYRTVHITSVGSLELDIVLSVVFLTLVHKLGAKVNETGLDSLWEIIGLPFIGKKAHDTILEHLQDLVTATESLDTWISRPYGMAVRFEDEGTLGSVRNYLTTIVSDYKSSPEAERQVIVPNLNEFSQHDEVNRFATSSSPLAQQAKVDIWESTSEFFTTGAFPESAKGKLPNPLYVAGGDGIIMPENPLMGFHLATSYTALTELSPLRPELSTASDGHKALASAKLQFTEWAHALCEQLGSSLTISFVLADPLAYCDSVQRLVAGEQRPGSYRMQNSAEPLRLVSGSVKEFDTIEASNATGNRIRTLLTLASATALLKDKPWATIYTEFNIRMGEMRENPLEDILFLDTPLMSLLLGVNAAEIAANSSSASIVDDVLLGVEDNVPVGNQTSSIYYRLSWKHNHFVAGHPSADTLTMPVEKLVDLLVELDHKMYHMDDMRYGEAVRIRATSPLYRLGLLVPLIKAASRNIQFPVAEACSKLLDTVNKEPKRAGIAEELHELTLQLHMRGLYSASYLADPVSPNSRETQAAAVPTVAAISVILDDFGSLESFFQVEGLDRKALTFEARVLHSKGKIEIFRDLQFSTGSSVEITGPQNLSGFAEKGLVINKVGGKDDKKLVVLSFWVPIALLVNEDVEFQLVGIPYPSIDGVYGTTLRKGKLVDELASEDPRFIVTPAMPSSEGKAMECSPDPPVGSGIPSGRPLGTGTSDTQDPVSLQFTAADKSGTLTARQNFGSELGRKLLADRVPIVINQSDPYSLNIVFTEEKDAHIYTLHYPAPVSSVGIKTRVARTTGYLEVIAPFATHADTPALSTSIFPSTQSSNGVPVPLNLPNLNLDTLPVLDLSDEAAIKWIVTLTSFQFSSKERQERESANQETGMTQSSRVNFKESLFAMFMTATGLQGGQTGLFVLNKRDGGGVQMLILVSAVRLDCASSSVVIDAAVIPLTEEMLKNPKIEEFLLLLRTLEICSLDVDEEELKVWKSVLPALSERCRTWEHLPSCEYKKEGATAPLSVKPGDPVLCSCGKGQIPESFIGIPDWEEAASKEAIRVAISPAFACPLVERTVDFGPIMPREREVTRCKACAKEEGDLEGDEKLRRCTRCLKTWYCSPECQKKDWKKHRFECKEANSAEEETS
ncbi:uncharacterized protein DNG_06987 [Cephalotrichum gorgonifer]|uniref:MYND-type domain-containing protein n=1 Tax=Cephalotrichum gorgonifer TaxID=2041049 RepID=A0AAE8SX36_9PEZI|nr:uncharacterized protein DNG_06987 [Cephalotrichum gorgonifer]